jgi:hypothetical protein
MSEQKNRQQTAGAAEPRQTPKGELKMGFNYFELVKGNLKKIEIGGDYIFIDPKNDIFYLRNDRSGFDAASSKEVRKYIGGNATIRDLCRLTEDEYEEIRPPRFQEFDKLRAKLRNLEIDFSDLEKSISRLFGLGIEVNGFLRRTIGEEVNVVIQTTEPLPEDREKGLNLYIGSLLDKTLSVKLVFFEEGHPQPLEYRHVAEEPNGE